MKAILNDQVIAEAPKQDLIYIEGNWYFPASSVVEGALIESPTPYTCPWKGECQYYHISVGGQMTNDAAWGYPNPLPTAIERVKKDFSKHVAFSPSVTVTE